MKTDDPCLRVDILSDALRDEQPKAVLTLGHHSAIAANIIRGFYRQARVVAYLTTNVEPGESNATLPLAGVDVRYASSLSSAERGIFDLAILGVSGYEGKQPTAALISQVWSALSPSGKFYVFTSKQRGARSQEQAVQTAFGNVLSIKSRAPNVRILRATKEPLHSPQLTALSVPDSDLFAHTFFGRSFSFISAAGVFSRGHVDSGTSLLIAALPDMSGRKVLDLGCGYGAIGVVVAASFPHTQVTMVDSSVTAIELARENIRLNGVETQTDAILSDGLRNLKGASFDTVLSHFPLHISKRALTRILNEAHDSLEEGGELYGVALSEYDVRPLLMQVFGNVDTISPSDDTGGYSDYRVVRSRKRGKAQIPVRTLHDPVSP